MEVSHAAAGLNWCGMNARNVQLLPDNHTISFSFGKGCIGCLFITRLPMPNLVGRLLILLIRSQQRSIGFQCLFGIDYHLQRFIIYLDSGRTVGCCIPVRGNHKCHFLHLEMHTIQRQHCLCICRECWHPGKPSCIKIFACNHCKHTRNLQCLTGINILDQCMRVGTTHYITIKHSR